MIIIRPSEIVDDYEPLEYVVNNIESNPTSAEFTGP